VTNISGPNPEIELKLQTNDFPIPELIGFLPSVTLPKDIHLNAPARLGCDLSGTTEAMNIKKYSI